jgi:hypothetical protein
LIKLTQEECERAFVNVLIRRNKIPHSDASLDIAEALSIIASRFSESDKMRLSEQDMTLLSKSLRAIASSGRNKIPKVCAFVSEVDQSFLSQDFEIVKLFKCCTHRLLRPRRQQQFGYQGLCSGTFQEEHWRSLSYVASATEIVYVLVCFW